MTGSGLGPLLMGWLICLRRRSGSGCSSRRTRCCARWRAFVAGNLGPRRVFPVVRDPAADGVPVTVSCRVLNLCRQQYCSWLDQPLAELDEAWPTPCSTRIEMIPSSGIVSSRMKSEGPAEVLAIERCGASPRRSAGGTASARRWPAKHRRRPPRPTTISCGATSTPTRRTSPGSLISPSIERAKASSTFARERPVLEPDCGLGDRHQHASPARCRAIEMAAARRGHIAGCTLHSDRGSPFRAQKVHRALARHSIVRSMGNIGAAADNAAMESFFSPLQKNGLSTGRWDTSNDLRIGIVTWIERAYHPRRRQKALGRLTPPLKNPNQSWPTRRRSPLDQPVTAARGRPDGCFAPLSTRFETCLWLPLAR